MAKGLHILRIVRHLAGLPRSGICRVGCLLSKFGWPRVRMKLTFFTRFWQVARNPNFHVLMPFRSNMLKLDIINNLRVNREALNNKRNRRTATILPVLNERMAFPFVVSPARLSCRRRPSKLVAAVQASLSPPSNFPSKLAASHLAWTAATMVAHWMKTVESRNLIGSQ